MFSETSRYFCINDGFTRCFENTQEAQKIIATICSDLISNSVLLRIVIEAARECGLLEKALDEWEELSSSSQTWDKFQAHFQDAEEKFNLKNKIYDKREALVKLTWC